MIIGKYDDIENNQVYHREQLEHNFGRPFDVNEVLPYEIVVPENADIVDIMRQISEEKIIASIYGVTKFNSSGTGKMNFDRTHIIRFKESNDAVRFRLIIG